MLSAPKLEMAPPSPVLHDVAPPASPQSEKAAPLKVLSVMLTVPKLIIPLPQEVNTDRSGQPAMVRCLSVRLAPLFTRNTGLE